MAKGAVTVPPPTTTTWTTCTMGTATRTTTANTTWTTDQPSAGSSRGRPSPHLAALAKVQDDVIEAVESFVMNPARVVAAGRGTAHRRRAQYPFGGQSRSGPTGQGQRHRHRHQSSGRGTGSWGTHQPAPRAGAVHCRSSRSRCPHGYEPGTVWMHPPVRRCQPPLSWQSPVQPYLTSLGLLRCSRRGRLPRADHPADPGCTFGVVPRRPPRINGPIRAWDVRRCRCPTTSSAVGGSRETASTGLGDPGSGGGRVGLSGRPAGNFGGDHHETTRECR